MLYTYAERRWKPILPILHHHLPFSPLPPTAAPILIATKPNPSQVAKFLMNIDFWNTNVLVYTNNTDA